MMVEHSETDPRAAAKARIAEGISISGKVGIYVSRPTHERRSRKFRQTRMTVFEEHQKQNLNRFIASMSLEMRRSILLGKHKIWRFKYSKEGQAWDASLSSAPMPSIASRKRGDGIWTVYRTAELAWILMGHATPENRVNRPWMLQKQDTFIAETVALWRFLNKYIEATARNRKGPKPNVEKLFKSALATYVARNRLQPRGGNPNLVPMPRHVQQVWFVLFGENESADNIKKMLPVLRLYLKEFLLYSPPENGVIHERFGSLSRGLEKKFGNVPRPKYPSGFII